MAQGLTLQQLQKMGAQPVKPQGLTLQQLLAKETPPSSQPKAGVTQTPNFVGTQNNATSGSTQAVPDNSTPDTITTIGNTAKSLVSGTIESGKDIGAAISAPIVQKAFDSIDKADQQGLTTILQLRQQAKAKGQDTTHFDNLIKNYTLSNNQTVADVFPALKKSNEQIIGDFASMALELASAGSYGNAAKGAKTGSLLAKTGSTAEKVATATGIPATVVPKVAETGAPLLTRVAKGAATGAGVGAGFGATGALQNNESPIGIAKSTLIGGVTGAALGGVAEGAFGARPAEKLAAKNLQTTVEAVNPELKGKNLVNAYKETVTGGRDITPPSIFKEQGLTPDQKSINLGQRLHTELPDVGTVQLSKNPVKNLNTLGTALDTTEQKITTLLRGDPELQYSADKPTLINNLDTAKKTMPREFATIRDSKNTFNNVIDFAKQTIADSKDNPEGLRDARTAFDAQAKREYPNAYKNGVVDTKTPAGQAIAISRNMINSHLYDTAPEGSLLKQLIGREADIFRATESIAPKAAQGQGKNKAVQFVTQFAKEHPALARFLGYGSTFIGGGVVAKGLGL